MQRSPHGLQDPLWDLATASLVPSLAGCQRRHQLPPHPGDLKLPQFPQQTHPPSPFGIGGVIDYAVSCRDRSLNLSDRLLFNRFPVSLDPFIPIEGFADPIRRNDSSLRQFCQHCGKARFATTRDPNQKVAD